MKSKQFVFDVLFDNDSIGINDVSGLNRTNFDEKSNEKMKIIQNRNEKLQFYS